MPIAKIDGIDTHYEIMGDGPPLLAGGKAGPAAPGQLAIDDQFDEVGGRAGEGTLQRFVAAASAVAGQGRAPRCADFGKDALFVAAGIGHGEG